MVVAKLIQKISLAVVSTIMIGLAIPYFGDVYAETLNKCMQTDSEIAPELKELAFNNYKNIDKDIMDIFYHNNWKLIVTNDNLSSLYFDNKYKAVSGVTIYSDKTIKLESRMNGLNAMSHEVGHFVDFISGNYSRTTEWQNAYQREATKISIYARSNPEECFAEAFELYCAGTLQYKSETLNTLVKNQVQLLKNEQLPLIRQYYTEKGLPLKTINMKIESET